MAVEKFSTVPCFSPNFQVAVTRARKITNTRARINECTTVDSVAFYVTISEIYIGLQRIYFCRYTKKWYPWYLFIKLYMLPFIILSYAFIINFNFYSYIVINRKLNTYVQFRHNCLYYLRTVNFARWNPDECQTDRLHHYVTNRGTAKVQDADRTGKMQDTVHPGRPVHWLYW